MTWGSRMPIVTAAKLRRPLSIDWRGRDSFHPDVQHIQMLPVAGLSADRLLRPASGMAREPSEEIINGVTIGEVLRPAGYRTLWTGKHHSTENPFDRGFDRYFGLRDGACNYFNPGKSCFPCAPRL